MCLTTNLTLEEPPSRLGQQHAHKERCEELKKRGEAAAAQCESALSGDAAARVLCSRVESARSLTALSLSLWVHCAGEGERPQAARDRAQCGVRLGCVCAAGLNAF